MKYCEESFVFEIAVLLHEIIQNITSITAKKISVRHFFFEIK